jgi:TldD protein
MYLEHVTAEGLAFDNGRLKSASYETSQGFGLRAVAGEASGYAHSGEISKPSMKRAAEAVQAVKRGYSGTYADPPRGTNRKLYGDESPLDAPNFADKVKLLETIDAYARQKDARVQQVTASLAGSYKEIEIVRADGTLVRDVRPLVRINVSIVVGDGDRQETGSYGTGGREGFWPVRRCRHLAFLRRRGAPPGTGQSRRRARHRPARSTWCSVLDGPASCSMRRSATASRATSIARARARLPG